MTSAPPPLEVSHLTTAFHLKAGTVRSVNDVSFTLHRGEMLGMVGESGSGKSVTGLSILRLIEPPGRIMGGSIRVKGQEITSLPEGAFRRLRGRVVSMIFQDPMTTLNPVLTIGRQFYDVMRAQERISRPDAMERAEEALRQVGIPSPRARLHAYPHQLSGGMRQRVCIAIALISDPEIVIADEPTTALDVTIQAQILSLVQNLARQRSMAMIWVTHDLSVVAGLCDRVAVMYAGRIVEMGRTDDVLNRPLHPYTLGLINSIPAEASPAERLKQIPGGPPSPLQLPTGCAFAPRCERATTACTAVPEEREIGTGHAVRCFHPVGASPL